jgi:hypothetical protein
MATFEEILTRLGPTAKPLMALLNSKDATTLLTTNSGVGGVVAAYARRWGFIPPPFTGRADGSFTIRTSRGQVNFTSYQRLSFKESYFYSLVRKEEGGAKNRRITTYYVYYDDDLIGHRHYCTRDELRAIRALAVPYFEARAATAAAAAGGHAVQQAPPTINPWTGKPQ